MLGSLRMFFFSALSVALRLSVRIAVREVLDRVWNHGEQHKSCIL